MRGLRFLSIVTLVSWGVVLSPERPAVAFGGSFQMEYPTSPVTVTDHRTALAIQPAQTILWDQIRFMGSPADFAWVLPVRPGAVLSLSQDAWFDALEASTQPIVIAGNQECQGPSTTTEDDPGPASPFGCGGGAEHTTTPPPTFLDAGEDTVRIVSEQTMGPYAVVVVHASQGASIGAWLTSNGYAIPNAVQPALADYAAQGFDFLALKLRPGVGVDAMQPVRVVTPGADTTLPLRMLAAESGHQVGIKLFVLSAGRYHPANYPDISIDPSLLQFDYGQQKSNYDTVASEALSAGAGTGWLTESAQIAFTQADASANPVLGATYAALCQAAQASPSNVTCASNGDTGATLAVQDGGAPPDPACAPLPATGCDDFVIATTGVDPDDFWVTRLRANLTAGAIVTDLELTTTPDQTQVSNLLRAGELTDPASLCPNNDGDPGDCAISTERGRGPRLPLVVLAFAAIFAAWAARRRK